uniref:NADH dehydrogenase subunit 6 n=1 Tax=Knipowitschia caucasica TaxID=637954 RepID=A0AAV2JK04_KNICA
MEKKGVSEVWGGGDGKGFRGGEIGWCVGVVFFWLCFGVGVLVYFWGVGWVVVLGVVWFCVCCVVGFFWGGFFFFFFGCFGFGVVLWFGGGWGCVGGWGWWGLCGWCGLLDVGGCRVWLVLATKSEDQHPEPVHKLERSLR